ncbi:unnamed protein product, partial [Rotaria sordida]
EVTIPGGSKKTLANVRVGDHVLVGDGTYEPVLDFIHLQRDSQVEYLRVSTRNISRPLYISADHLIFLFDKDDDAVFAADLRVGDRLNTIMSNGEIAPDDIVDIQLETSIGLYAPLTPSGTIVIDGIIVSNYAGVRNHRLAHQMMGMYRWWIRIFGPAGKRGNEEQVDVHWMLQAMEKFARLSIVENLARNEFFEDMIHSTALL